MKKEIVAVSLTKSKNKQNKIRYGDTAPVFQRKDLTGTLVDLEDRKGEVVLLRFFFPLKIRIKHLWYDTILQRKYGEEGFSVIGISSGPLEETVAFCSEAGVGFPIIVDQKKEIYNLYGIPKTWRNDGTIIIDRNAIVRFSSPYLTDEDLTRQLVEKYVVGSVNILPYANLQQIFKEGKYLPPIHLFDVTTGRDFLLSDFYGRPLIIAFFGTVCSTCREIQLISVLNEIVKKVAANQAKVIGITGKSEPQERISKFIKMAHLKFPVFLTADPIIEELIYISRDTINTNPLVVVIDEFGRVGYVGMRRIREKKLLKDILGFINPAA